MLKLEKLDFISYVLAVPEYNKKLLEGRVQQVKEILKIFSYPYNRRIAGAHGFFTKNNYKDWLKTLQELELARALSRLAQLNQSKGDLFWHKNDLDDRSPHFFLRKS
jgi:hypothetical protein